MFSPKIDLKKFALKHFEKKRVDAAQRCQPDLDPFKIPPFCQI